MLEIIGFLILCLLNFGMSITCLALLFFGGFELGNIFTSVSRSDVAFVLFLTALNLWFWVQLVENSPLKIVTV